jgi:hypothetical protein
MLKLKCRDVDVDVDDDGVVEDDHCPYSSCSHSHFFLLFLMACALVLYHPSVCFLL